MPVNPIPENRYFFVPMIAVRDGAAAIEFYKKAFGATEFFRMESDDGKIAHCEMRIGDAPIMLADEFPGHNHSPTELGGATMMLHLYVEDVDAFVTNAVKAGAKVINPPTTQPYGDRNAKLEDPFGLIWFFASRREDVSTQEFENRAASKI